MHGHVMAHLKYLKVFAALFPFIFLYIHIYSYSECAYHSYYRSIRQTFIFVLDSNFCSLPVGYPHQIACFRSFSIFRLPPPFSLSARLRSLDTTPQTPFRIQWIRFSSTEQAKDQAKWHTDRIKK